MLGLVLTNSDGKLKQLMDVCTRVHERAALLLFSPNACLAHLTHEISRYPVHLERKGRRGNNMGLTESKPLGEIIADRKEHFDTSTLFKSLDLFVVPPGKMWYQ